MKLLFAASVFAADQSLGANPIRRVVNMLQAMQKKVEDEGEKEKELYEKFTCYCKKNTGALTDSIATAGTKIAQLEAQIKEDTAAKAQTDEDLKNHKQEREDAKASVAAATKQREKEQAVYDRESGDLGTNVRALGKATEAIETGLAGGAFLQTEEGAILRKLVQTSSKLSSINREAMVSFLEGSESAPGSSEIVGILKEMKDEMSRDLGDLHSTEETAVKQFEALIAAKNKEIASATRAIEKKTQRSGELAVKIANGENDLEDTQEALSEDEKFQVNLRKDCAQKEKDVQERNKTRSEELLALSETIKVLNDDDALDLFKKTLPSPKSASFIQEATSMKKLQTKAQNIISSVAKTYKNVGFDFISLALKGKKVDFSKVNKLIDNLVVVLGEEQKEDDQHKDYCGVEFDTSDDKKKALERKATDLTQEKEEAETVSKNLAAEIKALQDGIVALDKSVAEATETRKSEHAEYVETSAANSAAVDLIAFAKNRLNKFYNPKLYKPPPPRELTEEERVYSNFGGELEPTPAPGGIAGTGISAFIQIKGYAAPPPAPETFGAYSKKSSESGGVLALIDALTNDIKADIQEAEHNEKESQEDYEELMADSQKKRAADSKSIVQKQGSKAEADATAENASENLASTNEEAVLNKEYIANLHKSCDFLVENYDFRKQARATEVEALKKAKAVLAGAEYSLIQDAKATPHKFLQ